MQPSFWYNIKNSSQAREAAEKQHRRHTTSFFMPASDAIFEALQVYAWGRVCFSAWDEVLERGGRLLGYDRWAPEARGVIHALYPAFFVFSAASKLTGPNAPSNPRRRQALQALMAAVCLLLSVVGARRGERLRLASR